jgi:hypothetical protein
MSNPWADPSTPTETGTPYAGPPSGGPYQPSPYGPPVYGAAPYTGYGYPPPGYPSEYPTAYGYPAPWYPPRRPQKPGSLVGAAVLALVQGGIVAIASLYLWMFASLADAAFSEFDGSFTPATAEALASEGTVLAIVQLLSAVLLVAAGIWALNSRAPGARRLLLAGHAVQVVLSLYWAIRLAVLFDDVSDGGSLLAFAVLFAGGPLVAIGLLMTGAARQWFAPPPTY